jgi:hypothetical protein
MNISYIIEKIRSAELSEFPFKHLELNELFEKTDFEEIIQSQEIMMNFAKDDETLFAELFSSGYKAIAFAGRTDDYQEYLKWHKQKLLSHAVNTSCSSFGVVLRLHSPKSALITGLQDFFKSPDFVNCIGEKFNIQADECNYDYGIQKYLDGYEISPHPDVRAKALTYMININPSPTSFEDEHHMSFLSFKPEWNYVREFWQGNDNYDRCWVPWDWCDIKKQQRNNNSIVIFSPDNDTIHAVKANYNHLKYQRTQIYGNLWYRQPQRMTKPKWEDFLIGTRPSSSLVETNTPQLLKALKKRMPAKVVSAVKKIINR